MGTNYYLHIGDEKIHIGKSSGGWVFLFRGYPNLDTFHKWLKVLHCGRIIDEYGIEHFPDKFLEIVSSKKDGKHHSAAVQGIGMDFAFVEFS